MIPLDAFGSGTVAVDLLQQPRLRDEGLCSRCRSDRTFNDKIGLRKWLFQCEGTGESKQPSTGI